MKSHLKSIFNHKKPVPQRLLSLLWIFDLSRQRPWDAAHLAVQSAVAAAVAFVVIQYLGQLEIFLAVLSAVLVIQPTAGNTLVEAGDRIIATLVGNLFGVVCFLILPYGYGTVVSLVIVMLVINFVSGFRPDWRYGVVAGVALALGSESNAIESEQSRAVAIALGALIGVAVSLVVWPDKASSRAMRRLNAALLSTTELLDIVLGNGRKDNELGELHQNFNREIAAARDAVAGIRFADSASIEKQIDQTERLYHSLELIERINNAARKSEFDANADLQELADAVREQAHDAIQIIINSGSANDSHLTVIERSIEKALEMPRKDGHSVCDFFSRSILGWL